MARIDAAYDYLSATISQSNVSRYDSHKKSTLRSVYNNIIKTNKDSPLYKISDSIDVAKFAIDIKESARSVKNIVAELSEDGDDISSLLDKKITVSSDPSILSVEYVGSSNTSHSEGFDIEVLQLAKPQVNQGNFLKSNDRSFEEGSFFFDLDTTTGAYEFQLNVNKGETNLDIQNKVARLINKSNVGLQANVITNDDESALRITSRQTGLTEGEEFLFKIQSGASWKEINTLGIGEVTEPATSSRFKLNGNERSSLSNTFTIERSFEITLHDTSEGNPVRIGFQANTDAIGNSINQMLASYNGMVAVGAAYAEEQGNNRLFNEVTRIGEKFAHALKKMGITLNENSQFDFDPEQFSNAVTGEKSSENFSTLNKFKASIEKEAEKTSINPMNYVNKIIVAYKNPGKTLASPYVPSIYSGLLMNKRL